MARKNKIEVTITGKDKASPALKKTEKSLKETGDQAKATQAKFQLLGKGAADLTARFGVLMGAAGIAGVTFAVFKLGKAMVSTNAEFERYQTQFKVLHGSVEAAQERLENLIEFAKVTPFELPEVIRASKVLKVFGQDTDEMLTIIGDAASGAGGSFEELAMWMGRISSGDTGRGLMRLTELGITSRKELAAMGIAFGKAGDLISSTDKLMEVLVRTMETRFGGQMIELSATFEGMMSNMEDSWWNIKRIIGEPLFEVAKEGLVDILRYLDELEATGTFEVWAEDIKGVANAITTILIPAIWALKGVIDLVTTDISKLKAVGEEEMAWAVSNANIFENLADTTGGLSESTFNLNSYFEEMVGKLSSLDISGKAYLETITALSDAHEAMLRVLSESKEKETPPTGIEGAAAGTTDYKAEADRLIEAMDFIKQAQVEWGQEMMQGMLDMTEGMGVANDQQMEDLIVLNNAKLEANRNYIEEWVLQNQEANAILSEGYQTFQSLLIRTDMTGSQKRLAILKSMQNMMTGIIMDAVKKQIAATLLGEKMQLASNLKKIGSSIAAAAAKIFEAHAGIPFVGIAIAAGFIAAMMLAMKKFKGFAWGTPYVSETGMYQLHKGERVVPRWENNINPSVTNYFMLPETMTGEDIALLRETFDEEVLEKEVVRLVDEGRL